MRKFFFLFSFMLVGLMTQAQVDVKPTVPVTGTPEQAQVVPTKAVLTFADGNYDTDCDYGTIDYNGEPLRVVKFKNTGTEPLIIRNARGSCGCTVPNWPKEPILPGEEGQIEIRYATNRVGKIDKRVTVTTNEEKEHIIRVIGSVNEQPKKETEQAVPQSAPNIIKGGN
ncbi:MAG: DUF1573 domain-containing protein [Saprospiraceae bacterium]|nr:DUF1573 domain-containing protein [Saprospiraceae bacterium]